MPRTPASPTDRLHRYRVLARVSNVINSSLEARTVLRLVLREAARVMRASSGSIVFIDPHTQLLEIAVATGLSRKAQQLKLPIGHGVTGWVAKTGKPLRVSDVTADPRYVSVRRGIRSELAVPLTVEGALIGVLNVDSTRSAAFSAEDEELLVALANQAARVIHHAWLYEAVALNVRKLESLFAVAQSVISSLDLRDILQRVTREACQLMSTKVCSLMLLDATRQHLELRACHGAGRAYLQRPPLSVSDSLIGVVVRRRKPVQVYNVQAHDAYRHIELARREGLVSLLSVPLSVGETVIGALNVYTGQLYRFSNQDIRILSALSNLAAITIENARLHERSVQIEEQLRRHERLSTLGLLAAEIAHEIRNPLTVMKMLFHSLDLQFAAEDPRARDAEIMAEKMEHLNRIVDQLLGVARANEPAFAPVNVNEMLEDVLLLVRHRLSQSGITLRRRFANGLPAARADRGQLEQACLNLALNAAEAMPDGGTLTVTTALHPSSRVLLAFQDTGIGMTGKQRDSLFEPFLTGKPQGTGLGLAMVKRIVEAHGGRIEVDTAPGKGATFRLLLPV
jgi:signal transduction histidine kinase